MYCKNCGNEVAENAAACLNCGADPKKGNKFCQNCGEPINDNQVICLKCGASVKEKENKNKAEDSGVNPNYSGMPTINIVNTNNNTNTNANANTYERIGEPKKKWVAFVLCLLLGWLGVHKFYEGKTGMGVLYLFTFALFGIGIIVDAIVILGHTDPYYVYH